MAQVSYEYLSSRPPSLLTSQLPYDDLLEGPKGFAGRLYGCASEVLKVVKLQGALFYNAEFSSPWSVYAAASSGLARFFATGTEHVIVYPFIETKEQLGGVGIIEAKDLNEAIALWSKHPAMVLDATGFEIRPIVDMNGTEGREQATPKSRGEELIVTCVAGGAHQHTSAGRAVVANKQQTC